MQIILIAIGSSGDVNPFIVLGAHLKKRGHEVKIIVNPHFSDKVQRAGLEQLPLGTEADFKRALSDPEVWNGTRAFAAVWKEMPESIRLTYELIKDNHKGSQTILIGSSLAFGARLAQEKFSLPLATVHLAPAVFLSIYNTPESLTHPLPKWYPDWLKRSFYQLLDFAVLDRIAAPSFNEIRRSLSLPPVKSIMSKYIHSPDLVVGAFPDWFASVQADWPKNSYTTNFPLYKADLDQPLGSELKDFLEAGEPPVIFTAGSAMAFSKEFFQKAARAARAANKRALLVSTFPDQIPAHLPNTIQHLRYANFNELFTRAAAAVHHGGVGTSAMSLASACPQVTVPFAHDQFDNGLRMQNLGVGLVQNYKSDLDSWVDTLKRVDASEIKSRCETFAEKIALAQAAEEQIADLVFSKLT